ncbi:hypothetical protein LGW37_05630, partial [Streptococcus mutans]|nr:hypothetical protein [Streptococcus mutans]
SLMEFNRLYAELGIDFDSYNGEAFYNDKMEEVVQLLAEKGLLPSFCNNGITGCIHTDKTL